MATLHVVDRLKLERQSPLNYGYYSKVKKKYIFFNLIRTEYLLESLLEKSGRIQKVCRN